MKKYIVFNLCVAAVVYGVTPSAKKGEDEMDKSPVRYIGKTCANTDYYHGQLRLAVGTSHFQVLRANRTRCEHSDGFGWTYNHAPMLAFWNGRFYLQYLSNPVGEHIPPGQTLITSSVNGRDWERPKVAFPVYEIPDGIYKHSNSEWSLPCHSLAVMHQRMGFYTASSGRLLTLGFYGICATSYDMPNDGTGIGRVVREIYENGCWGPVYFLRYNRHAGWNESNTKFPFYKESSDTDFVKACDELLNNKLVTLQWWEEDRSPDNFYACEGIKALSYYHLDANKVVGLGKGSKVIISHDNGKTWSKIFREPTLIMSGGKVWGQRMPDDKYILIYNPTPDNIHRWPLALVTSTDGLQFDNMLLVNGKISPRRYQGNFKDLGFNYVRGICEGNGIPEKEAIWVTYSMNKEDIWISRIPVPIQSEVEDSVDDDFSKFSICPWINNWNIYCGKWATVSIVDSGNGRAMRLVHEDPADVAQAERVFPLCSKAIIKVLVRPNQINSQLYIEVSDDKGLSPLLLYFDNDLGIKVRAGSSGVRMISKYETGKTYEVEMSVNAEDQNYIVTINGKEFPPSEPFFRPVNCLQRLTLRTGPVLSLPTINSLRHSGGETVFEDFKDGSDMPVAKTVYDVIRVSVTPDKTRKEQ